jgi:hypothetical protein
MKLVKVEDKPYLRKDTESGAILNVDNKAKDDYLSKKNAINRQKEELKFLKDKVSEIDNIKKDMQEIKELLQRIASK